MGRQFRIVTFGESHGPAVGVVIDGVRPGLPFSARHIQKELDRRKPGQSKVASARKEDDLVEVLSGVFEGKTTGTPICLLIRNRGQSPREYDRLKEVFRPGHAGYVYLEKYGIYDHRGGGRASGRETAARVAAGAFAKTLLGQKGVRIIGHTVAIGTIQAQTFSLREIEKNSVRCADRDAAQRMERLILRRQKEGDSVGGVVEVIIRNAPAGLGDPVFGKLDADLAAAMMSIGAVKGVEIGAGFASA
ncbi:MAG: chorismate synthase, partial [Ignavibacteria bacterium]|nr:chorismate synthase [Ignavibacteria bacterium]